MKKEFFVEIEAYVASKKLELEKSGTTRTEEYREVLEEAAVKLASIMDELFAYIDEEVLWPVVVKNVDKAETAKEAEKLRQANMAEAEAIMAQYKNLNTQLVELESHVPAITAAATVEEIANFAQKATEWAANVANLKSQITELFGKVEWAEGILHPETLKAEEDSLWEAFEADRAKAEAKAKYQAKKILDKGFECLEKPVVAGIKVETFTAVLNPVYCPADNKTRASVVPDNQDLAGKQFRVSGRVLSFMEQAKLYGATVYVDGAEIQKDPVGKEYVYISHVSSVEQYAANQKAKERAERDAAILAANNEAAVNGFSLAAAFEAAGFAR